MFLHKRPVGDVKEHAARQSSYERCRSVLSCTFGRFRLHFRYRKKGSGTKKRMKEGEIEKGDCGPPTRKVFFEFLSDLNQVVPNHLADESIWGRVSGTEFKIELNSFVWRPSVQIDFVANVSGTPERLHLYLFAIGLWQ